MLLWLFFLCFLGIPVIWRVSYEIGEKVVTGIYCLQLFSLRVIPKDIAGILLVPLTLPFFHHGCWLLTNPCKQMDQGQRWFRSKPGVKNFSPYAVVKTHKEVWTSFGMQSQEARERSEAEQSGAEEEFFIQQQIACVRKAAGFFSPFLGDCKLD